MIVRLGHVEDLAHLRRHLQLGEIGRREAARRLCEIGRRAAHEQLDRRLDGRERDDEDARVADELERTFAEIVGRPCRE